jgi:hypothetical protein
LSPYCIVQVNLKELYHCMGFSYLNKTAARLPVLRCILLGWSIAQKTNHNNFPMFHRT